MTDQIRDILKVALEDNLRLWDVIGQVYDLGVEDGKQSGLPGVTSGAIYRMLTDELDHVDDISKSYALEAWFNDPNRDAPVKPTMHPDLEWLARFSADEIMRATRNLGDQPVLFRWNGDVSAAREAKYTPPGVRLFTLETIEQARKHLAGQSRRHTDSQPEPTLSDARKAVRGGGVTEDRTAVMLDLDNLPDYETWFEDHGHERTTGYVHTSATVHELYTHFRARLLDELRQAGVIGEEK